MLDAFSGRTVGWSMGHGPKAHLVLNALDKASTRRRPVDVIHHSDWGSHDTFIGFGPRCKEAGVRPSMRSIGPFELPALMRRIARISGISAVTVDQQALGSPIRGLSGSGNGCLVESSGYVCALRPSSQISRRM